MGLFTLPPKTSQDALDLELFLKGERMEAPLHRTRKTLLPEWFPQSGVQLTWPHAETDWAPMLERVEKCYVQLAYAIASREHLLIVHPQPDTVRALLEEQLPQRATQNITYFACPTNDTWARDHAFLTVLDTAGIQLLDYRFNGWGGKFEAALDNAINRQMYDAGILRGNYVDRLDFELEGGSIESDGLGILLTTSTCLLNPNRNPQYDKGQVELRLAEDFGVDRVLWLDHGALAGDDTDSHIDTLARLCPHDTILYVRCDDTADEHHAELQAMEQQLQTFQTREGKPYRLLALPLPDAIYDEDGERLPATYANYLVMNSAVLYPTYNQPEKDRAAKAIIQRAFPTHEIVGIDCTALIVQHGSLHCATMQFPKGVVGSSTPL